MSQNFHKKDAADNVPKLMFAQDAYVDSEQNVYVVVALSQRKQSQIMKSVGQVHCDNQPFPTWSLVGQVLSEALFNEKGRLKLKSSMELHQKDYLLFERDIVSGYVSKSESVLEIDFGRQSDCTWLGYWKTARPVVVKLVKNGWFESDQIYIFLIIVTAVENLARLSEPDRSQTGGRHWNGGIEIQGTTDEGNQLVHEESRDRPEP